MPSARENGPNAAVGLLQSPPGSFAMSSTLCSALRFCFPRPLLARLSCSEIARPLPSAEMGCISHISTVGEHRCSGFVPARLGACAPMEYKLFICLLLRLQHST